jgi:hypothetical protein
MNEARERSDECAEVLIAGREPPRVRVGYSCTFALYQVVVALGSGRNEADLGLPPDPRWRRAAARAGDLRSPLGPFNYFEFALVRAAGLDDFRRTLAARALEFASELSDALASVDELYRREVWPAHQASLDAALKELAALLKPRKDRLLGEFAALLGVTARPAECVVTLVPTCHIPMGGYSHPTVLDVTRFRGSQLLEALVHELAHVLAASAPDGTGASYTVFRDALRSRGRSEREAAQLFHLVIFHTSGRLVHRSGLPDHRPIGEERGVYGRVQRRLGTTLTPAAIDLALSHWQDSATDLPGAMAELADALPRGLEGGSGRVG